MQHWSSEGCKKSKKKKKKEKKKKRKEWSRREGLKQACEGFLMAQISFCKKYLLESDTEGLRFYFFQNCALGKLQKLNRKYEIWKLKKGTKSLQSGQKVTDMEKQRILAHLSFVPNLI